MILKHTLRAEFLKLKRTLALKLVILAPAAVVLLTLFMVSTAPFSTVRLNNAPASEWRALTRLNLQFWGLLMLPLYLTVQTALIASLDHTDNQWKALFARPVHRSTIYLSKLLVVIGMAAASALVLFAAILLEGTVIHQFDPELRFRLSTAPVIPILQQTAQMTGLAFFSLTISHWISLRWRSFSVAVSVGAIAIVTSFGMLISAGRDGAWPQYFPWALPALVIARHPHNVETALWIGAALGVLSATLGCADFCRREVS